MAHAIRKSSTCSFTLSSQHFSLLHIGKILNLSTTVLCFPSSHSHGLQLRVMDTQGKARDAKAVYGLISAPGTQVTLLCWAGKSPPHAKDHILP